MAVSSLSPRCLGLSDHCVAVCVYVCECVIGIYGRNKRLGIVSMWEGIGSGLDGTARPHTRNHTALAFDIKKHHSSHAVDSH